MNMEIAKNTVLLRVEDETQLNNEPIKQVDTEEMQKNAINNSEKESKEESKELNEFSYLERGGFSSEKFKIEIDNMPKFFGLGEFKKLLRNKLSLDVGKVKQPKGRPNFIYVCFQNEESLKKGTEVLNGYNWKGKTLKASKANPAPDPLMRKRKQEENKDENNVSKKVKDDKSVEEKLCEVTTPLAHLPYEEQLSVKEMEIIGLMQKLNQQILDNNGALRDSLEEKSKQNPHNLCFKMLPILKSPVLDAYRNKCEFTVGCDDFGVPVVGFRFGSYVKGDITVAPVDSLLHVSENMKNIVKLFEEFVKKSPLVPYSPVTYEGFWRQLTVRESIAEKTAMVIIAVHPQELAKGGRDEITAQLIEHFTGERGKQCHITSLYFQTVVKQDTRTTHLWGEKYIFDQILGLKFRISPEAFFQVNTPAAEVLYQSVMDMCELKKDSTTVIDVCCGTGTIGLCFSKNCKSVMGIESVEEAVKDAKANAEANGIENCDFYTGLAEDRMAAIFERVNTDDVIAVVDPPRAGLHGRAIKTLRNNRKLKSLVYISCSPASAMKNFVDLSRASSKTMRGAPFLPTKVLTVDLFPHTRHVEVAILFKRDET